MTTHCDTASNQSEPDSATTSNGKATRKSSSKERKSRAAHFVLQGKGGIGKTLVASLIAQAIKARGEPVVCLDTDPVQNTLAQIESLTADVVELLDGDAINVTEMDAVISRLIIEDTDFVIDGGASSFVPLSSYLLTENLIALLAEHKRVVIHSVIVGGRDIVDTAIALRDQIEQFPDYVEKVAWLNPFYGKLEHEGIAFIESAMYQENKHRLAATIQMPKLDPKYAGACFQRMIDAKLTFEQALENGTFDEISKWRLANVWTGLKNQMEAAL